MCIAEGVRALDNSIKVQLQVNLQFLLMIYEAKDLCAHGGHVLGLKAQPFSRTSDKA